MNHIQVVVEDGIGVLELSRPAVGNAIDLASARELSSAARSLVADPEVRVVLVEAAGDHFCVGGDVRAMAEEPPSWCSEVATTVHEAVLALHEADRVVVAAVQGAAAGAGFSLVLLADLVVATPATRFIPAWSRIGLTPDGGASWLLPRAVGSQRTAAMLIGGKVLEGTEALDWGLVTELVDNDPRPRARALAASVAQGGWRAAGATRRMARTAWDIGLPGRLVEEASAVGTARAGNGPLLEAWLPSRRHVATAGEATKPGTSLRAPFAGTVTVHVSVGDEVTAGSTLATVEAMKLDAPLTAPRDGTIDAVRVADGERAEGGEVVVVLR
ncbi:enoyl-CoA hydratase-related protein [Nocardioides zeae]|uniref:2-(1,2-epoxy-1,2-dihydrophenyl)acetyl-CoA isomerase n=1 Tax=Nocardioides zeae TaxID=1457234 RepID=A0AAJ1X2L3_9ACTN|nr:enoyl-CoA hydratase-related protein [Nocardioides zeae]MDQ1105409.1 2-(1,2-epoxy-1,2-dihydrophenyl)acetyl-CoA isomerase [Nocardioides zeae]